MNRRSTSLPTRVARITRLAAHLARGLWTARRGFEARSTAEQDRTLERWARELLAILRVEVGSHNAPVALPERCLLVANHTSWLDIFAVHAVTPGLFVAKADIRDWPVVGRLVARVGTLFIERGNRRHARRTNERIVAALESGRLVAVCPEGTTTDGRSLRHFHAALLQPAIDARAMVQPVAIRYLDADGEYSAAAAYVGDDSLLGSIWRIVSARSLRVELRYAPCLGTDGLHRRDLTRAAHEVIARELGLPAPHRAPGTAADPPAGSPPATRPTRSPCPAPADPA